ncbi:MAG: FAD-binding protein, partial [Raoultibacter sp.]
MTEKDKRAMMGVSRRSFLAAAGIGALGVAGAGMFGCAPKGASEESALAADEKTPVAADETLDVQVCVLGAGPAGVTAAIEAAEKGAEVLVVDLNGAVTGNAHSVCACSTDYQHALGNDETPEEFVDYLLHYEDNPIVDKDLTLLVARESSKSIEWLSAHGVEFSGVATSDPEPFELP